MSAGLQRPVLVLEDSDEDFDTVEEAARRAGLTHMLRRATTGDACLRLLRGEGVELVRPAMVLLDLNTPGMDGRQTLAAIRADPALRELPVVVLSTSSNPRDVAYSYAHGVNAYHVKPVQYPEHLSVLHQLLVYWLSSVTLPAIAGGPL